MKICNTCKMELDESRFTTKNKEKQILSSKCKSCVNAYSKEHYIKNPDIYKSKANKHREKQKKDYRQLIDSVKSIGCYFCSEKTLCCLDFHHSDGDKEHNVASMTRHSIELVQKEISKCIVVCSNCHRKIHAGLIEC